MNIPGNRPNPTRVRRGELVNVTNRNPAEVITPPADDRNPQEVSLVKAEIAGALIIEYTVFSFILSI